MTSSKSARRRARRGTALLVPLVAATLASCSSGPSTSYLDGQSVARSVIESPSLIPQSSDPATECSDEVSTYMPQGDDPAQWEAGCTAELKRAQARNNN